LQKITKTRKWNTSAEPTTKFKITAVLPFVEGLSNFTATYSNKAYMLLETTQRLQLEQPKNPADLTKQEGDVYRIPCECGKVYISKTGRPIKDRMTHSYPDLCHFRTCTQHWTLSALG